MWGARRSLRESDRLERLFLAGLYAGVLAFAIVMLLGYGLAGFALGLRLTRKRLLR